MILLAKIENAINRIVKVLSGVSGIAVGLMAVLVSAPRWNSASFSATPVTISGDTWLSVSNTSIIAGRGRRRIFTAYSITSP